LGERSQYHDLRHGWQHGQQIKSPPASAVQRLFRPIRLVFDVALPRVEAVTSLVIRRQLRRSISPTGFVKLVSGLTHLETIFYEPWEPYDTWMREFHDRGTHTMQLNVPSWHLPFQVAL
jgi:hypothetical protein